MPNLALCYSDGQWWLAANGRPINGPPAVRRKTLAKRHSVNSDTAINLAATLLELEPEMVKGNSRMAPHVRARQIITLIMREQGVGYNAIGRRLYKDHTSILYFWRTGSERRFSDPEFEADYQRVRTALLGTSA